MEIKHKQQQEIPESAPAIFVLEDAKSLPENFPKDQKEYILRKIKDKEHPITVNLLDTMKFVQLARKKNTVFRLKETYRKDACKIASSVNKNKLKEVYITDYTDSPGLFEAFLEGFLLSNYQFLNYKTNKKKHPHTVNKVNIVSNNYSSKQLAELQYLIEGVFFARDLTNHPVSYLSAEKLAEEIEKSGKSAGFNVEIFEKKRIEALRMGGLLAVNKGSFDPPTFTVMEWKPENAVNEKPYVLVGKGVVFDTGGMSLKPTSGSMDSMKCDMSGAAVVAGAMFAIAKNRLPVHVVGLVPATDNRPGNRAYVPQDVVTMHNGMTVEVMNTDAEGRMILADALSYADKYNPGLIIELSTLTGSAHAAIGHYGMVGMGTAGRNIFNKLVQSGENTYERVVEFPFWDEYDELIKSDVADMKNIGGRYAGAITAGKFLAQFTKHPFIHLDIAGPAFLDKKDSYRGTGGTGTGVRLLYDFLKNRSL